MQWISTKLFPFVWWSWWENMYKSFPPSLGSLPKKINWMNSKERLCKWFFKKNQCWNSIFLCQSRIFELEKGLVLMVLFSFKEWISFSKPVISSSPSKLPNNLIHWTRRTWSFPCHLQARGFLAVVIKQTSCFGCCPHEQERILRENQQVYPNGTEPLTNGNTPYRPAPSNFKGQQAGPF